MPTRKAGKTRPSPKSQKSTTKGKSTAERKRHYEGPAEWLLPMMEEAHAKLGPKDEVTGEPAVSRKQPKTGAKTIKRAVATPGAFKSAYHEGKGEEVLAQVPRS